MGKLYIRRLCRSFAKNAGITFSYSCSMLDCPYRAMRYHFAGWSPGTTIEQNHCLALASTILHRPLSSNMAAVGGQFTEFYGRFLFVQWVYFAESANFNACT